MKLATLHDGSRDGQLVVVSRDLASAHFAAHIAGSLRQVLDDWNFLSPQLEDLYATLNSGKARHAFAFDPRQCLAPLPRAALWSPAGQLARGDAFLRPCASLPAALQGAALQWHWVAACGALGPGADESQALDSMRLLMLALCFVQAGAAGPASVLATAFAPVAASLDELGPARLQPLAEAPALKLRRRGRLSPAEPPAEQAPGLATHIASLAGGAAALGLPAGALVGALAAASEPWAAAGEPEQLHCEAAGLDGHSLCGALELRSEAPQPLAAAEPGAEAAAEGAEAAAP